MCYICAVFRALLVAAVLCISFEVSGLAAVFGDESCSEECPTDVSGGQCAPNCPFCGCCSLPKTMNALAALPAAPCGEIGHVTWGSNTRRPPSPDPRDILHVPRALLA
jgi:hypothetical protein